jgi:hypothetical protein
MRPNPRSNLLFAATLTPNNLLPSLENGFIGGDVGCSGGTGGSAGALHLAGLYAGGRGTESRAGLPNPLAAQPVDRSSPPSDGAPRDKSDCHFRKAATDYVDRKPEKKKRLSCTAK